MKTEGEITGEVEAIRRVMRNEFLDECQKIENRLSPEQKSMLDLDNPTIKDQWMSARKNWFFDQRFNDILRENIKLKEKIEHLKNA